MLLKKLNKKLIRRDVNGLKMNKHSTKMNYLACTRSYKCNDCNNYFEFTWNAAVNPIPENVTCPKCNSKNVSEKTLFSM